MPNTQYIGSRYVPLLADPIEWSNTKEYEPLTIVTHEGNSYTSRQFVPKGVDISNNDFWALTGNYNGQVEEYRRETQRVSDALVALKSETEQSLNAIDGTLHHKVFSFDTASDMQAYADLKIGDICSTLGFGAVGDNGAGIYIVTNSTPNGYDLLENANGTTSALVVNGSIVPEQIGADGTGVRSCAAALNYLFTKYFDVELVGKYLIKDNNVYISTASTHVFSDNRAIVNVDNATIYQTIEYCRYENIEFHSARGIGHDTIFDIRTQSTNNDTWFNFCWFSRCNYAIRNTGINLHIENCNGGDLTVFVENRYDSSIANLQNRAIVLKDCKIQGARTVLIFDDDFPANSASESNHVSGCHFDYCGVIVDGYCPNLHFTDNICYCNIQTKPAFYLRNRNETIINASCVISNNIITLANAVTDDYEIVFDGCAKLTFSNNVFSRIIPVNFIKIINGGTINIDNNVTFNHPNNLAIFAESMATATRFLNINNNHFAATALLTANGYCRSIENNYNLQFANTVYSGTKPIIFTGSAKQGDTFTPNVAISGANLIIAQILVGNVPDYVLLIPFGTTSFRTFARTSVRNNTVDLLVSFTLSGPNATGAITVFTVTGHDDIAVTNLYMI